jgi:hypothetical protein
LDFPQLVKVCSRSFGFPITGISCSVGRFAVAIPGEGIYFCAIREESSQIDILYRFLRTNFYFLTHF